MSELNLDHVPPALLDAWTGASEANTEFEMAIEELTEVAEREGWTQDWEAAIKALRRAAASTARAANTVALLLASTTKSGTQSNGTQMKRKGATQGTNGAYSPNGG